jgi:hypothetical protein
MEHMELNIKLPRWLARTLFPSAFNDLKHRSRLTGTANRMVWQHDGEVVSAGMKFSVDDDEEDGTDAE